MSKLTRLFNCIDNKMAIIHAYNGKFRVLDGDNVESFYYDYSKALCDLLNKGYKIGFIDNNQETYGSYIKFKS